MRNKGFTLIEVIITLVIIGLLAMISVGFASYIQSANLDACAADLRAHAQMSYQLEEQARGIPDTEFMYQWATHRKSNYHYVPNNYDANKGHGNDLDLCDEENPGASLDNRECLDIKWVWVCDHNHGDVAKYNFVTSELDVWVVPVKGTEQAPLTKDLNRWTLKDPNLQKWIGR